MEENFELYELTNPQKSLLYIEQFYENSKINIIGGIEKINEKINFSILEKAINLLVENNDGFRIRLHNEDNTIKQYFSSFSPFKIDLIETDTFSSLEAQKGSLLEKFALFDSPLYKFKLFKTKDGENGFIMFLHHLICDAWTVNLAVSQIFSYYNQLENCEISETEHYSYKEYISSEQNYLVSNKFINDKLYWEETFNTLPDFMSLKSNENFSLDSNRKEFILPETLLEKINVFCSENNISQYIFFLSIFSIYFKNIFNSNNYTIGTPILNRSNFKEKNIIGTFINTAPFVVNISDTDSFVENCEKLSIAQKQMYRHIKYPFKLIQQYIKKQKSNITNLFDIILSYQNAKINNSDIESNHTTVWMPSGEQLESLMIHIKDTDNTGKLFIDYDYLISVFSDEQISLMHNRIIGMAMQVLAQPNLSINDIEIITEDEKKHLIYDLNNTKMDFDTNLNIIDLFEKQVSVTPKNIAVNAGDFSLSYETLNNRANTLANELKKSGITTGDIVGILLNRNENIIISIFAILKLGATYMPIDPDYPYDRVSYMIENSSAKIIISTTNLSSNFLNNSLLLLDNLIFDDNNIVSNLGTKIDSNSLAYIMYTSGSTGNPKAVCIKHYNVINFVKSMQHRLDYTSSSDNKVLSVTTMCFDIFVFEVFPTLLSGLQLVIATEFEAKNPQLLNDIIVNKKISKIMTTPSRINLLFLDNRYLDCLKTLKEILLGGEPFPKEMLPKLQSLTSAKICNLYGPTETTVYSTYKDLTVENYINIGKPIENTQIYILNENNKLLPVGAIGEICIGGSGVGSGYYKNQELTDKVFVQTPYDSNNLIYKTGDLGKWTEEGELLCLGRKDFQIKIRGYRVELDDIVSNILTYPNIAKAVVINKQDSSGKDYLCAYIVSTSRIEFNSLQKYLSEKLPNYMVPSHFMQIDEIPLTLNHKVNRKALPEPEAIAHNDEYIPPINEIQKELCTIVANTLSIDKIGITNDIFDYQIDSLNIIEIQTKLLQKNIKINTQDFYKYRTIQKICDSFDIKSTSISELNEPDLFTINNSFYKHSEVPVDLRKNTYNNILLLGATGYLGIHLLKELLETTTSNIYCLVRSKKGNASKNRLVELYNSYFDKDLLNQSRVKILDANIINDNFGLDSYTYTFLQNNIDLVLNSAANVKYYGDLKESININVTLTQKLIDFCIAKNIKFSYISTLGISGNLLVSHKKSNNVFTEDDFYIEQNYKENIYISTKFEAEKLIYSHIKDGLNATIFRIGNLTGRYSDGVFQKNIQDNAFYNILKLIISSKIVPESLLTESLEFTPVDLCSSAICSLLSSANIDNRVFHLYNNNYISADNLISMFNKLNFNIEILDNAKYKNEINKFAGYSLTNVVVNNLKKDTLTLSDSSVLQQNSYTNELLGKIGFQWKSVEISYIEKIVNFIKKIKFI